MVFAQAVAEYGVLSAIVSAVSEGVTQAQYFVTTIEPRTWVIAGMCLFVVAYIWNRAR